MRNEGLRHLFEDYCESVVLIGGRDERGEPTAGTGFHIGNGLIATARHVASLNERKLLYNDQTLLCKATYSHSDPKVDLAVIESDFMSYWVSNVLFYGDERRTVGRSSFIPLGGHLDDWIDDSFITSSVLLMGYPRVPLTKSTPLLAQVAEVNGVVDRVAAPHPYFIISSVPRGGFSGGPVLSEFGFLLGVLTESLTENAAETGFSAVLTIEPLLDILSKNGMRPPDFDDDLWHAVSAQARDV